MSRDEATDLAKRLYAVWRDAPSGSDVFALMAAAALRAREDPQLRKLLDDYRAACASDEEDR